MTRELVQSEPFSRNLLTSPLQFLKTTSSVFNSEFSLNPLFDAAAPLLAVANKITPQMSGIDPIGLRHRLVAEVETFERKARELNYRSPIILAARYFLCAYIDEIIENGPDSVRALWQQEPLLKTIQGENWGGRRFFLILERAIEDPQTHIHLLELAFVCLTLGYQGKYKREMHHAEELEHIRDNLFELISHIRGPHSSKLYYQDPERTDGIEKTYKKIGKRNPSFHWITSAAILIVGVIGVCIPYHMHLANIAGAVEESVIHTTGNLTTGS